MKFLILACILGFAAASFIERAAPVVDEHVTSMLDGMSRSGSLRAALDMPDLYELDRVEEDVKTELGKMLREQLNKLLEKVKDTIDHGKQVKEDLLEKVKEIKEKLNMLKEDIGGKAKELLEKLKDKAKDFFKDFLNKILGKGGDTEKRSLDHLFDELAKFSFKDLIERLKEKISNDENIQRIREYVRNFVSDHPLIKKFKEFFAKLRDVDIKEYINSLFHRPSSRAARNIKEHWKIIKDFFKDRNIELKEKLAKFGDWMKNTWNKAWDNMKEKHQLIKAICLEAIAKMKDASSDIARETLEFFQPYKEDLGSLWSELVKAVKENIGNVGY